MSKEIETIKLDNGLTIYLYEDSRRHSTFFQFVTKFGGKYREFYSNGEKHEIKDGVAHILEHYIVEHNKYGNFLKILGEAQMNTNASTNINMTSYYFEAVENVKFGVETLLKGIYNVVFNDDYLNKIKEPIYQEIRGRMNNKFYHSNIESFNNLFNNIKFRNVGGSLEDVANTTLEDIMTCYNTFYQPSNQFIIIAGNFNKDEIISYIVEFYNNLDIKNIDFKICNSGEVDSVNKKESIVYYPTASDYIDISYKINLNKYNNREKLNLDFYLNYFCKMYFGITSPIYKRLVDNKIISGGIGFSHSIIDNYLVLSIGCYVNNADEFINCITKSIKELDYFNEEYFDLDKKRTFLDILLRDESLFNTIFPFIDNVVNFDYPFLDTVEDVNNFSFEEFVDVIKNIDFNNYSIVRIENKKLD